MTFTLNPAPVVRQAFAPKPPSSLVFCRSMPHMYVMTMPGLNGSTWPLDCVVASSLAIMQGPDEPVTHETHESDVLLAEKEIKPPPLYAVVLLNDDYTPMEFVIEVLQSMFGLSLDHATDVMLTVHYMGKGTAGIFPYDIAATKAQQVIRYARQNGHPLLCQIEPE